MNNIILITGITGGFGRRLKESLSINHQIIGTTTQKDLVNGSDLFHLDLFNPHSVLQFCDEMNKLPEPPSCLILNAGIAILGAYWELTDLEIKEMLCVNALGYIRLLRNLKQNPLKIVYISSIAAKEKKNGLEVYGHTKALMEQFIENLEEGIKALIVRPGPMLTGNMNIRFSINQRAPLWRPMESEFEDPAIYVNQIAEFLL